MVSQTSKMFNPFQTATESYQSAMEAGVRFQQDAVKTMVDAFTGGKQFDQTGERFRTFCDDSMDLFKKNIDQSQKIFDDNCRMGMDLMRGSFETVNKWDRAEEGPFQGTWEKGFDFARSNAEAVAKAGTTAVENWARCMTRTHGEGRKEAVAK